MAGVRYLFRYFRVVSPVPGLLTASFAVATMTGLVVAVTMPARAATAAVPLLLLQAFSASTGFSAPARRGHFDLLLTRGEPRMRIAIVQWLTAIAPGVVSWILLALAAVVTAPESSATLLRSGTATAMLLVSTVPWAVTVSLPRFSGAIGWLLLISVGTVAADRWPAAVRDLVFPVGLMGQAIGYRWDVVLPAIVLSAGSVATALIWVHRRDIPLEAGQ